MMERGTLNPYKHPAKIIDHPSFCDDVLAPHSHDSILHHHRPLRIDTHSVIHIVLASSEQINRTPHILLLTWRLVLLTEDILLNGTHGLSKPSKTLDFVGEVERGMPRLKPPFPADAG